jgi:ABC-2 type transport system permease protein
MIRNLTNIFRLGVKELYSLRYDLFLVFLIVYSLTFAVYEASTGSSTEIENASIAVVDEDRSILSMRIRDAFMAPYFSDPVEIEVNEIDAAMDSGDYAFVVDIPPRFQEELMKGHSPDIQVNVDATAMSIAGRGASYVNSIIREEVAEYLHQDGIQYPATVMARVKFNPNLESSWFQGVMELINNLTMLALILTGAALIREREHGTIEHLLVMPLRPFEIMLAKVWANGLVILVAAVISLYTVVQGLLGVPIEGSIPLFVIGAMAYLFSVTSLGIFLATVARTMPQFGLLAILAFLIMGMLSGVYTPMDSMPTVLRSIMQFSPSTHFVSFAQAVLFRGADIYIVWHQLLAVFAIGALFFAGALLRFRKTISVMES